jgi:hypothetical protein
MQACPGCRPVQVVVGTRRGHPIAPHGAPSCTRAGTLHTSRRVQRAGRRGGPCRWGGRGSGRSHRGHVARGPQAGQLAVERGQPGCQLRHHINSVRTVLLAVVQHAAHQRAWPQARAQAQARAHGTQGTQQVPSPPLQGVCMCAQCPGRCLSLGNRGRVERLCVLGLVGRGGVRDPHNGGPGPEITEQTGGSTGRAQAARQHPTPPQHGNNMGVGARSGGGGGGGAPPDSFPTPHGHVQILCTHP